MCWGLHSVMQRDNTELHPAEIMENVKDVLLYMQLGILCIKSSTGEFFWVVAEGVCTDSYSNFLIHTSNSS